MPVENATGWSKRASAGSGAGWATALASPARAKHVRKMRTRFMITA
jgi:hypothetical protein